MSVKCLCLWFKTSLRAAIMTNSEMTLRAGWVDDRWGARVKIGEWGVPMVTCLQINSLNTRLVPAIRADGLSCQWPALIPTQELPSLSYHAGACQAAPAGGNPIAWRTAFKHLAVSHLPGPRFTCPCHGGNVPQLSGDNGPVSQVMSHHVSSSPPHRRSIVRLHLDHHRIWSISGSWRAK